MIDPRNRPALIGSGIAIRGTLQKVHMGRLSGFFIDFLLAIVAGFIALNRMEMFTGLDAVGEAFNGNAGWLGIVVVGWLVSGFAEKAGAAEKTLKLLARWTMVGGLAVLALSMGLLPGLVEFARRLVQPEVVPLVVVAIVSGVFARILYEAGIRSTEDFASMDPAVLLERCRQVIEKHGYW